MQEHICENTDFSSILGQYFFKNLIQNHIDSCIPAFRIGWVLDSYGWEEGTPDIGNNQLDVAVMKEEHRKSCTQNLRLGCVLYRIILDMA